MARVRKTSEQDVMTAARALFWQHGYAALGTRRIEAETGLTRFTLQTVYKGKMALYLRVLDDYLDMMRMQFTGRDAPKTPATLIDWFARRSDPARMPDSARFGCLLMNAVIEFHGQEPRINERAELYLDQLKRYFFSHLVGHVAAPEAKAEVLAASALGLNAVIRAGGDMAAGQAISASIGETIAEWAAAQ